MATITISENTGATHSGFVTSPIKENNPTTNYSSGVEVELTSFDVGDRTFTVAQINGLNSVTEGGTVTNAKIRINATNLSDPNLSFEAIQCLRTVVQAQVTWNVYSTGNSWATAGGLNTTSDIGSVDLANVTIPVTTTNAYYELTGAGLTQWVQDVIDGTITNADIMMRPDPQNAHNGRFAGFVSENGTDGRRPELVFDYAVGTTYNETTTEAVTSTESSSSQTVAAASIAESVTAISTQSSAASFASSSSEAATASHTQTANSSFSASLLEALDAGEMSSNGTVFNSSITETSTSIELSSSGSIFGASVLEETSSSEESSNTLNTIYNAFISEVANAVEVVNASVFAKLLKRIVNGTLTRRYPEE